MLPLYHDFNTVVLHPQCLRPSFLKYWAWKSSTTSLALATSLVDCQVASTLRNPDHFTKYYRVSLFFWPSFCNWLSKITSTSYSSSPSISIGQGSSCVSCSDS